MNLEKLAAFRGEAWARRELRRTPPGRVPLSEHPWPGHIEEARRLAGALGNPRLLDKLAAIIQRCASATWSLPPKP
jgi:hypothetical protein